MVARISALPRRTQFSLQSLFAGLLIGACAIGMVIIVVQQKNPALVEQPSQPIVAAYDMVDIPVPAHPVRVGMKVKEIAFRRISYPRHQVPTGAVLNPQELGDSAAVAALPANMPLFVENFSKRQVGMNPVVEKIPPGMRAMTIRVDATSAVEGWAGSGSIVDVLLITHEKTAVIAEQVKVLSAERVVVPVEGASSPQVPSTVTLLVNQDQCLAINTAIPLGKIAFALRSPEDQEGWQSAQYTAEKLKGRGGGVQGERSGVSGYFSIAGNKGGRSFALLEGKWVETEVVPEGFRVMTQETTTLNQDTKNDIGGAQDAR